MDKYIDLDSGKLFYRVNGKGIPIILIHGGPGGSHDYFIPFAKELCSYGFRVIMFDQRGNGYSKNFHIDDISVENFVSDIESIRKDLELDSLNIFAHSYGNVIASRYCKLYSDRVLNMFMCGINPTTFLEVQVVRRKILSELEFDGISIGQMGQDIAFKYYVNESIKSQFHNSECRDDYMIRSKKFNINKKQMILVNRKLHLTMMEDIAKIEANYKVIVLRGKYDLIPESASIGYGVDNSKLIIFNESGHYPFIEEPSEVIEVIRSECS